MSLATSRRRALVYLPRRQGHPRTLQPHGGLPQAHWAVLTRPYGLPPGPSAALSTRRLWQRVQAQPTVHEARNARSYCSGRPGGTEADGETSSMEGRMLRCVLWIQSQRLHVEALAGWSPVVHGTAPFTNSCYCLPLPPLSAHWPWPVSTGFGPHLSYWYLKPCLNVCLSDKCIETLRRHWNWLTHQSDGKRHPVTDDKSGSGNTGQLPGLLRRSPAVDPVQVEEEALIFAFLLVLETSKSGDNYKDHRVE